MNRKTTAIAALIVLVAGFALAGEETRVQVSDHYEGTNIDVHLPLNLVLTVLNGVDAENFNHGRIEGDNAKVKVQLPMEFMNALSIDHTDRLPPARRRSYAD